MKVLYVLLFLLSSAAYSKSSNLTVGGIHELASDKNSKEYFYLYCSARTFSPQPVYAKFSDYSNFPLPGQIELQLKMAIRKDTLDLPGISDGSKMIRISRNKGELEYFKIDGVDVIGTISIGKRITGGAFTSSGDKGVMNVINFDFGRAWSRNDATPKARINIRNISLEGVEGLLMIYDIDGDNLSGVASPVACSLTRLD